MLCQIQLLLSSIMYRPYNTSIYLYRHKAGDNSFAI
jgi:hypothetical protein